MFAAWRNNLAWILFALGLSAVLWVAISGQENPYRDDVVQNVAVEVQDIPSNLILTDSEPAISVKVSAPLDVWRTLQASSLHASVDASRASAGHQDLPIKVESSDWRVRVQSWQPASVGLQFEAVGKKEVPVKVSIIGEVPFGYVSRPATASPQQVTVTGPDSLVSQVDRVTVDVKLLDTKTTINQRFTPVPLAADGHEVTGVTIAPETVAVEVPIEQQLTYKTVAVTPRIVGSVALGYQLVGVMIEPTTVTVVGDPNALRDLNYLSTQPVNVTGASSDVTLNTDLELPPSVSVVRQQGVIVRAYVSAAEGSQVVSVVPTVTDLPSGLTATVKPNTVRVSVSGPMPILSTLKAKDVRVVVDGSKLEAGTHVMTTTVDIPEVLQLISTDPLTVTVTVK